MISFGSNQESVNKTKRSFGISKRYNQKSDINIRSNNVCFFGKVDRFSNDVILTVIYFCNNRNIIFINFKINLITNRNWVSVFDICYSKFSSNSCLISCTIFRKKMIPATSRFYDNSFQYCLYFFFFFNHNLVLLCNRLLMYCL